MENIKTEIVVLGGGPGGYAAAFYAADRGKKVVLVDRDKRLGGVCVNHGCIPSKALLHVTRFITDAAHIASCGIEFGAPSVNLNKIREWKESVIVKLAEGVSKLAGLRHVDVRTGHGTFENSTTLRVVNDQGECMISFEKAIVAVGSRPQLPNVFSIGDKRVMTSTGALELTEIPDRLLVIGGGYIGLELGTVYAALGSAVVLAEAADRILSGVDTDLTRPVLAAARKRFHEVRLNADVRHLTAKGTAIDVGMAFAGDSLIEGYDRVLVAVGRKPNSDGIGLEHTSVKLDDRGFIQTGRGGETGDPHILAIGDVSGGTMLAHKAARDARVAVDAITGEHTTSEDGIMPAVVFTDPEVAWCGITEEEAKHINKRVEVAKFRWGASGRALTLDRPDGLTKLIVEPDTERVLGMGVVGVGAGELIAEGVVAIEMGATVEDLAASIHPHPTLSETIMEAAEVYYGTSSHAVSPTKKSKPIGV